MPSQLPEEERGEKQKQNENGRKKVPRVNLTLTRGLEGERREEKRENQGNGGKKEIIGEEGRKDGKTDADRLMEA